MPAPANHNGRTRITPRAVRFSAEELACLTSAAEAAGVTINRYVVEASLAIAARDGYAPPRWRPTVPRKGRTCRTATLTIRAGQVR